MNKRLHILFLSSWYPSKSHRTLGNFVQRHAESVATIHDVHVLYVTSLPGLTRDFEIEHGEENNVRRTIVYYRNSPIPFLSKWKAFKKGIAALKQRNEFNFDLVHHNVTWPAGWQPLYLKRKYGLKYIITEHWTGFDLSERKHPGKIASALSKRVVRNASVVCPVTENLANVMRKFGLTGNYKVVPNVVDTSLFHPAKTDDTMVRFLHVSSLDENQKNISGILRAWKEATGQSDKIHLTIGGDGPWENAAAYARELEIPEHSISFFGELPWSGIADLMHRSHCFILFSNYENLPCVIVESMASGMAVISTNVGGISEHIGPQQGILVGRRDERALTEAILKFESDRTKFEAEALSKYATAHFSIASIAQQFDQVYNEALKNTNP